MVVFGRFVPDKLSHVAAVAGNALAAAIENRIERTAARDRMAAGIISMVARKRRNIFMNHQITFAANCTKRDGRAAARPKLDESKY